MMHENEIKSWMTSDLIFIYCLCHTILNCCIVYYLGGAALNQKLADYFLQHKVNLFNIVGASESLYGMVCDCKNKTSFSPTFHVL